MTAYHIAVLAGDGIGPEVIRPSVEVIDAAIRCTGMTPPRYDHLDAGAALHARTGESLPELTFGRAAAADAILLGAMGLPNIRYEDGREIAPQLDLRERLQLFAGVRPIKALGGLPLPLADPRAAGIDAVIVRESTEGLFAARGKTVIDGRDAAHDTMTITRTGCERLFRFSFELARRRRAAGRPGLVTCVDKANVLGAFAFFRGIFDEVAREYPDIQADHCYVDAMALNLVKRPWALDVLVTENMFGDILSDLGAALMGGMGLAPSADIGAEHAVFQPCHGSAPDIAGKGTANPTATFLSAAMMFEWLGDRHKDARATATGRLISTAVEQAFAGGDLVPVELGGSAGTEAITARVVGHIPGATNSRPARGHAADGR
jgi:3-isopropylmalate dehydrogenase